MSEILITGGAGLQGSRLAARLLAEGHSVTLADNFSRGSQANINELRNNYPKGLKVVKTDLRLIGECVYYTKGVEAVFHLAAHLGGVEYAHGSKDMPSHGSAMASDNLLMDTNMIKAAVQNNVSSYLYPSTACIYPVQLQKSPDSPPLREDQAIPAEPESPYGWAKLMGERLSIQYAKESGIHVAICRLFNIYGEGEDSQPGSHVVPELMRKALNYPQEPFVVYGDGSATRAFTYVDDAVEGLLRALKSYACADPINIGSDKPVSICHLAELIIAESGKPIRIEYDESKPVGVMGRCADISKARDKLGWEPRVPLEEGLKRTWSWYVKHHA